MTVEKPTGSTSGDPADPLLTTAPAISESQAETNAGVARATGVVALGNIASRVLGLAREIVIANLFGVSAATDALRVAIIIPRNFYDLLIGGHVNGAIIPVLSEVTTKQGRGELWRVVSVLLSMVTAVLAALVLLLQFGAPLAVRVVSSGADEHTLALAAHLLRITSPALIFMGLFAVLSGTLYALRVFTWPAFGTAVFNGAIVVVALLFAPSQQATIVYDGSSPQLALTRPDSGIAIVALGWLTGSIAYVLLQLPGLRGARLRFTLSWRHPAIRQIGLLYLPVMFSLVLDTLVVRVFSYNLASQTGAGSISYMDHATTLIQFPQGLVATAISIAILPTLSRQAALITGPADDPNRRSFQDTLGLGLRLAITLILPATVGLFVLATPIITLLFEHGAFTAENTRVATQVLRLYLLGLPFAALDLLLVYAFYARQDTLTPALVGLFSLGIYMLVAILLFPYFGLFSLMLADSTKHVVHATISAYLLNRRLGGLGGQRLLLTSGKTGLAALAMGLAAAVLLPIIGLVTGTGGLFSELALVMLCGGIGAAVYLALALALKVDELRWLVDIVRQRLAG
jgi:putative peptidoglycan lipid II flippase